VKFHWTLHKIHSMNLTNIVKDSIWLTSVCGDMLRALTNFGLAKKSFESYKKLASALFPDPVDPINIIFFVESFI